ncbi:MAG TPA: aminoglycoside adenylyltransferase domain-containing protein [Thermoplasmata archaeon]|nr:aminoglycoside adenylyltransferase domain-containing protein [Thermoplasmata archaeon]
MARIAARAVIEEKSEVPKRIAPVCIAFVARLRAILGKDLAAVYLYGAAAFPETPAQFGDTDLHVILHRPPSDTQRRKVRALHGELAKRFPGIGDDLDVWYITTQDAHRRRTPRHQLNRTVRDESWALHRAHWLAGRYHLLHGTPPEEFCVPPSWREIERALRHEFRFAESQINNERAQAFCVLNLSRILFSVRARNVVVSKGKAAQWALRHLPARFRPAIRAASRVYRGEGTTTDRATLRENARELLSYSRQRMNRLLNGN